MDAAILDNVTRGQEEVLRGRMGSLGSRALSSAVVLKEESICFGCTSSQTQCKSKNESLEVHVDMSSAWLEEFTFVAPCTDELCGPPPHTLHQSLFL